MNRLLPIGRKVGGLRLGLKIALKNWMALDLPTPLKCAPGQGLGSRPLTQGERRAEIRATEERTEVV